MSLIKTRTLLNPVIGNGYMLRKETITQRSRSGGFIDPPLISKSKLCEEWVGLLI